MTLRKCIVAGFDGSETSRKAVEKAAEMAKLTGARLYIVTIVPPPTVFLGEMLVPEVIGVAELEKTARERLEALAREVREKLGVEVEPSVAMGDPAEGLVKFAEERKCSLIVVGKRGRSGLERLLLGSVSSKVVSLSRKADVLVVAPEQ